jgi:hypothetical protein
MAKQSKQHHLPGHVVLVDDQYAIIGGHPHRRDEARERRDELESESKARVKKGKK